MLPLSKRCERGLPVIRMYVPVTPQTLDALRILARRDMRHPKDMASVLLVRTLREMGALTPKDEASPAVTDEAPGTVTQLT